MTEKILEYKEIDGLNKAQRKDFYDYVFSLLVDNYKEGAFSRQRTRWALTKAWNSKYARAGIPRMVRDTLGEEAATRLFQDDVDSFLSTEGLVYIKEVFESRQKAGINYEWFSISDHLDSLKKQK